MIVGSGKECNTSVIMIEVTFLIAVWLYNSSAVPETVTRFQTVTSTPPRLSKIKIPSDVKSDASAFKS